MKKNAELLGVMKEYEQRSKTFESFTEELKKLIFNLLKESGVNVLSVESRTKDNESLKKTLAKKEKEITRLNDIPDISGLRIITFFTDDVDLAANVIETEFDIDEENSVDKRLMLDPDRFGYLSLHYVVRLSASRQKLTEYRRFKNCHAEVQIRSILQHAWAEIEHDLGYKSKLGVPKDIRRRFSRLAGLLEVADDEFVKIRDELSNYEENVPERIAKAPESVLIDGASLASFIETNPIVQKLDSKIASLTNSELKLKPARAVDILIYMLHFNGISTIAELESSLRTKQEILLKYTNLWYPKGTDIVTPGICINFLCDFLVGKTKSLKIIRNYLKFVPELDISEQRTTLVANHILSVYSKMKDNPS